MPPTELWPSPLPLWQAAPEAVAAGLGGEADGDHNALTGPWRLLLLGDGSPTRHLQSLTGIAVDVEVIAMEADNGQPQEAPPEVAEMDQPLLRRQVWLRCGTQTLAWAESWWNQSEAERHLQERSRSGAASPPNEPSSIAKWMDWLWWQPPCWRRDLGIRAPTGAATTAFSGAAANSP